MGEKTQLQPKHLNYFWFTYATFHLCANSKYEAKLCIHMEKGEQNRKNSKI